MDIKYKLKQSFKINIYSQIWLPEGQASGVDVESMNSNSYYFAYLYIPASETMPHQKRMSIADQSCLRRQTVEINCKN
jgi:hypothetical protein